MVCLPSHAEGFGFAIAEVCAMQKPLITTNVASIPEVVSGEVMFVEPGNQREITETITGYLDGSKKPQTVSPKTFRREDCIQKVISVYKSLLVHR